MELTPQDPRATNTDSTPTYLEFYLTDGSLAQAGTSFNLVPRRPEGKPVRRFRRLGSLSISA